MLKKHVELSHTHLKYLSAPIKVALYQKYLRIPTGIQEQFKENTVFFWSKISTENKSVTTHFLLQINLTYFFW